MELALNALEDTILVTRKYVVPLLLIAQTLIRLQVSVKNVRPDIKRLIKPAKLFLAIIKNLFIKVWDVRIGIGKNKFVFRALSDGF
jgi:hypothetical protein